MSDFDTGLKRASSKETNNHKEGRSGAGTPKKTYGSGGRGGNPGKGGGINRATNK
jgi:hypothetical protein